MHADADHLNIDLAQRVAVAPPGDHDGWSGSPAAGVVRHRLERAGAELARATSIVRYAAGSRFPRHVHGGGEEFLVLEGTFEDAHGRYPAGTYVRNPPGTAHAPWSSEGCVLFVKLWHFEPDDTMPVVVDTALGDWRLDSVGGIRTQVLHRHGPAVTWLARLPAGARLPPHRHRRGVESLVLDGTVADAAGQHGRWSWLRLPAGASSHVRAGAHGATLFVKAGHFGTGLLQAPEARPTADEAAPVER